MLLLTESLVGRWVWKASAADTLMMPARAAVAGGDREGKPSNDAAEELNEEQLVPLSDGEGKNPKESVDGTVTAGLGLSVPLPVSTEAAESP